MNRTARLQLIAIFVLLAFMTMNRLTKHEQPKNAPAVMVVAEKAPPSQIEKKDAYQAGRDAFAKEGYAAALNLWLSLPLEQMDAETQFKIGWMYGAATPGSGIKQDYRVAEHWFRRAADRDFTDAQRWLGVFYGEGREGVRQDRVLGYKWLRLAAEAGDKLAEKKLAEVAGQMTPGEIDEARRFIKAWKDQKRPDAQTAAVVLKPEDTAPATAAAPANFSDEESPAAQLKRGIAYHKGDGVRKSPQEAVKWWRKAAERGNSTAQLYLGIVLHTGDGIAQDDKAAAQWLGKAAAQGDAAAQEALVRYKLSGK